MVKHRFNKERVRTVIDELILYGDSVQYQFWEADISEEFTSDTAKLFKLQALKHRIDSTITPAEMTFVLIKSMYRDEEGRTLLQRMLGGIE